MNKHCIFWSKHGCFTASLDILNNKTQNPTPRFPKPGHFIKFSIFIPGLLRVNLFGTLEQRIMTMDVFPDIHLLGISEQKILIKIYTCLIKIYLYLLLKLLIILLQITYALKFKMAKNCHSHNTRRAAKNHLQIPASNTKFGMRTFAYRASKTLE